MALTLELFQTLYDLRQSSKVHYKHHMPHWFEQAISDVAIEKLAKWVVQSYQERNYQGLNEYLRQEQGSINDYYEHEAELLNTILNDLPLPSSSTLWREEHYLEEKLKWAEKHLDEVLLIPSFWSTYSRRERCPVEPTYQIKVSIDTKARLISEYTGFQKGEAEALYKRGTRFRIVAVDTCIHLEEVDDVEPDLTAFDGYTISQKDEDHEDLGPLSLSDLGFI